MGLPLFCLVLVMKRWKVPGKMRKWKTLFFSQLLLSCNKVFPLCIAQCAKDKGYSTSFYIPAERWISKTFMESSKMVQSLIGLRTLSQNWFRHFVAFQWNESDLCWLWCWFMRWDNLLLVKYSDLHTLSNVSTWSRFTHFLVFWLDLAIYALCRILMKCRDLRIFPGTNYRFPGTKNFSTPLLLSTTNF